LLSWTFVAALRAIAQEDKMIQRHIFRIVIGLALGCCFASCLPAKDGSKSNLLQKDGAVTIEYIAHACFRVTSPSGKQILLDPYASRVWLGYDFPPNLHADAILISHPHYDHDGGEAMGREVPWAKNTSVFRNPGTNRIDDVTAVGYAGKHADPWGKEFGQINTIWLLEVGGLRIVHLGDNGPLRDDTIRQIGRVDVLMIPIDSQFHILKSDQIAAIRSRLSPPILIPMHYRHDDLETSPDKPELLGGIDDWAKGEANVRVLASHMQELSLATLPKKPEVIIFKHSPLVKPPLKTSLSEK
jgi:L-ascorbate metabolism protein UlaG (beta-lactamase superfamily)